MMLMHPNNSMDCNRRTPFYSSSILLEAEDNSANGIAALIASSCTPTATTASPSHGFQGSRIFEGGGNERKRAAPTSSSYPMLDMSDHEMGDEEGSDGCVQLGEKKRRLTFEQVKALEKNFEVANKLEPEKKMQLAKALGLQPRQIAVWFQNRRARWKTKQLEKDFTVLKDEYDSLKHNYDKLIEENGNLQAMVERLSSKLQSCHEQHNSKLGDTSNTNSNSSKVHNEDGDAERPYLMVNSLSSNFVCKDSQDNANEGPASETSSVLNMDSPGTATIDSHYTTDSAHLCEEAPPQHNPEFIRPKVEDNEPSQSDEPCNLFYSNLEHGGLWWEYWPQGI